MQAQRSVVCLFSTCLLHIRVDAQLQKKRLRIEAGPYRGRKRKRKVEFSSFSFSFSGKPRLTVSPPERTLRQNLGKRAWHEKWSKTHCRRWHLVVDQIPLTLIALVIHVPQPFRMMKMTAANFAWRFFFCLVASWLAILDCLVESFPTRRRSTSCCLLDTVLFLCWSRS